MDNNGKCPNILSTEAQCTGATDQTKALDQFIDWYEHKVLEAWKEAAQDLICGLHPCETLFP